MIDINVLDVAKAVGGLLVGDSNAFINGVSIDSRKIESNNLYIPIVGENHDGHDYIKDVVKKKVTCFLVQKDHERPNYLNTSYIVVDDTIPAIEPLEYVCYERGAFAETALPVKAFIGDPYHNRSYDCFSSHMHFPFEKKSDYPAICLSESIGYCAFPLFRDYIKNGNRIFRELIRYLIDSLLPDPFIETNAPPWVELTVRMQPGRIIIHVLCYIAEHKTKTIDTVDSRMMLCNLSIKLRQKEKISRIFCVRSGYESEDYSAYGDSIEFTIPEINGYDVIIAEYQT